MLIVYRVIYGSMFWGAAAISLGNIVLALSSPRLELRVVLLDYTTITYVSLFIASLSKIAMHCIQKNTYFFLLPALAVDASVDPFGIDGLLTVAQWMVIRFLVCFWTPFFSPSFFYLYVLLIQRAFR